MVIQAMDTSDPKQRILTSDPMVPKCSLFEEQFRGYPLEPLDDSQRSKQMFLLDEWSEDPKVITLDPNKTKKSEINELKVIQDLKEQDKGAWILQVDGSSNGRLGGIGIHLECPGEVHLDYVITLDFKVTNNEAEYEALLVGLKMTKTLQVKKIKAYTDSQLVQSQYDLHYERSKHDQVLRAVEEGS